MLYTPHIPPTHSTIICPAILNNKYNEIFAISKKQKNKNSKSSRKGAHVLGAIFFLMARGI